MSLNLSVKPAMEATVIYNLWDFLLNFPSTGSAPSEGTCTLASLVHKQDFLQNISEPRGVEKKDLTYRNNELRDVNKRLAHMSFGH